MPDYTAEYHFYEGADFSHRDVFNFNVENDELARGKAEGHRMNLQDSTQHYTVRLVDLVEARKVLLDD